jgi:N6-L-threonylcarbamoyladenine synthase
LYILSIESSCDETSAAIVKDGREVLSCITATQIAEHRIYGGVVPEIASRRHTEAISAVVKQTIDCANLTVKDINAIAVTFAPGLIGALLVGVNFAKGLAASLNIPLIPVHHLRSHIAAVYLEHKTLEPPFLCLLASGGNSHIVEVKNYTEFSVIGRTRDDAAGECFDKCARVMGMGYPGGVELDKIADATKSDSYKLPTPSFAGNPYDFSFSGLKTAVINTVHNAEQKGETIDIPALCGALRKKVCDILIGNTLKAAENFGYKKIAVAGGVSANSELRSRFESECANRGLELYIPPVKYCGDNAAMVGAQGYYEYLSGNIASPDLNAFATLPIDYK